MHNIKYNSGTVLHFRGNRPRRKKKSTKTKNEVSNDDE